MTPRLFAPIGAADISDEQKKYAHALMAAANLLEPQFPNNTQLVELLDNLHDAILEGRVEIR